MEFFSQARLTRSLNLQSHGFSPATLVADVSGIHNFSPPRRDTSARRGDEGRGDGARVPWVWGVEPKKPDVIWYIDRFIIPSDHTLILITPPQDDMRNESTD